MKKSTSKTLLYSTLLMLLTFSLGAQEAPEISVWKFGDGTTGKYYTTNGDIVDTGAEADVQEVWYTADSVYIVATGVPSYLTGPFLDGNPGVPEDQNWLFRITRSPQAAEADAQVEVPLGAIGVLINGTLFENYSDGMSYNNDGTWSRNANIFEIDGLDCMRGHPQGTAYHHHQNPVPFNSIDNPESDICNQYPAEALYVPDPNQHSPIIGYAFDGYPLYGPFAYSNTDGTGGIKRMKSSYQTRNITERTTYPDGTSVTNGPAINDEFPLGSFKEDFEYVTGSGDLDEHNGRWAVTPEYPEGTYAYYTTEDDNGHSAYPFFIGPYYYGVVDECNFTIAGANGPGGIPSCDEVPAGLPCCGDGICGGPETEDNCPEDCGGEPGAGTDDCNIAIPSTATQYVSTGTSVKEFALEKIAKLYPNPAKYIIYINLYKPSKKNSSISVFNLLGENIYTNMLKSGTQQQTINIRHFPKGVYLLQIQTTNNIFTQKIMLGLAD